MSLKLQPFLHWWGEGLYTGLPAIGRHLFRASAPTLILQMRDANHVEVLWQQEGKITERGVFSLQDTNLLLEELLPPKFRKKPYQVMLRLRKPQVLYLQHHFPEVVKDNIRQVVGYQLDRLTPFTADNAFYDAKIATHDKVRKEVLADIYVTPRRLVDLLISKTKEAGIKDIHAISVIGAENDINLLRSAVDKAVVNTASPIPLYVFLAALAIALLAPMAYQWWRLQQLEENLSQLRQTSSQQINIRDKLLEAGDALKFLEEKRRTSPVALDVVEKLSSTIPDHTWLERLSVVGKTLEIRGESGRALTLIDLLEETPEFANVRFKSPVTRNKDNGRDRFHIEATVETNHAQ